MKLRRGVTVFVALVAVIFGILIWALVSAPPHPIALLRVVDSAGKPIAGAVIVPDGLRPKPGPYNGHYSWRSGVNGVSNNPVSTDAEGYARVPYPKFIEERIETGEISFSVDHPDYVKDRPFREVATAPPAGAPWKVWLANIQQRLQRKQLVTTPKPVILQKGAILKLVTSRDSPGPMNTPLYAQITDDQIDQTNDCARPESGTLIVRRVAPGAKVVRALRFDSDGMAWFSDPLSFTAVSSQTNQLEVMFHRSATVRGRLDDSVPRPVLNGRVIAHVSTLQPANSGEQPGWHSWSPVREDGSFDLVSLPPGKFGIVALCDGFVSKSGQSGTFTHPQIHELQTNDLEIAVTMQPTATLVVKVDDPGGKPLKDASVGTWPNVSYEEWGSTILASDCYNHADLIRDGPHFEGGSWFRKVRGFQEMTDSNGIAVLFNLPAQITEFSVGHSNFVLPAIKSAGGGMNRYAPISLSPGATNRASVRMEKRDVNPLKHY